MKLLQFSKFAELREKTDRELLILIDRELDRALILASLATARESPFYEKSEKIHKTVRGLLLKTSASFRNERHELEAKLEELRVALESQTGREARGAVVVSA